MVSTSAFLSSHRGGGLWVTAHVHMPHPQVPFGSACPDCHHGGRVGRTSCFSLLVGAKNHNQERGGLCAGSPGRCVGSVHRVTPRLWAPRLASVTLSWTFHPSVTQLHEHINRNILSPDGRWGQCLQDTFQKQYFCFPAAKYTVSILVIFKSLATTQHILIENNTTI